MELADAVDSIGMVGVLLTLDARPCTAVNSIESWATGQKIPLTLDILVIQHALNEHKRSVKRVCTRMPQQMDSFVNVTLDGILIQMQQTANRVILVEQIDLKHFEIHVLIQDPL